MPLSLHPLRERNTTPKHKNRFWKILKKFRNLLEIQKNDLPLHPLRMQHTVRNDTKKGSEKILKNSFKKIWWFGNKHLSLHHFPLKNRGQNSGRGRKADPGEIKEIVLIVIYWTAFFEVFEQLKVFSTLAREWFQTIPLRLELKIYNKTFFYNGEFDPGSGWTLAAGLTHASRGAARCSNTLVATGARVRNAYATYP